MQLHLPTPEQGLYGLRAMKTVALADGALDDAERAMLHAGQSFTRAVCDIDALESISPDALADAITDPAIRRQLVHAMVIMTLVDEHADKREIACVETFADALCVGTHTIGTIRRLARGHLRLARLDILRRFWAVDKIREQIRDRGLRALWDAIKAARGRYENPAMAARYRALETLPAGTLGRAYVEAMNDSGFPLPGEPGAAPETITYHDMTHVLGDYGTTPSEEVLVASFSAGYRTRNPMTFILFVICQFHLGIQTAPNVTPETGHFDPVTALAAVRRGAAMNVDLSDGWEYWDVIDQPVDALRERYNIAPRTDIVIAPKMSSSPDSLAE